MKAVLHRRHGEVDALEFVDVPTPEPAAGEVLVRVDVCGLNHLDVLQRRGPALIPGFTLPHIAGMDIAGTVVECGPGREGQPAGQEAALAVGTRVVINPAVPCGYCRECLDGADGRCPNVRVIGANCAGGYAEFVTVPMANAHPVPESVSQLEAAVVPTVWMTAWHALLEVGRLRLGETALIHAGGSGVSTAAIQLAKAGGARVITTVSSDEKADYVRGLGADVVVNSATGDVVGAAREATGGRGVELVIDHVGPAAWNDSIYSLAPRGRLVFLGNTSGNRTEFDLVYAYHFGLQLLGSDPYDRREFATMLDAYWHSEFVTPVDGEYALADAAAAQERMQSRRATGKIVLRP